MNAPSVAPEDRPEVKRASALMRFTAMRLAAASTLEAAARLAGLPEHHHAQAKAAAGLCKLRLHTAPLEPDPEDATGIHNDLEAVARTIVDPLVRAIGAHAAANFHGIDTSLFERALSNAIEDALANLIEAGRRLDEDRREAAFESRRPRRAPNWSREP